MVTDRVPADQQVLNAILVQQFQELFEVGWWLHLHNLSGAKLPCAANAHPGFDLFPQYDYSKTMFTVNVATLKEKLSHFLKLVEGGQEVVVTSYRQKVARILPMTAPTAEPEPAVRPVADLLKVKGIRRRRNISAVESLMEDRRAR